jgi:hypothetical protein
MERERENDGRGKERGRENPSPFVFGHRGERRRICFSLVLFVDRREGKHILNLFSDLHALIRNLFE